MSDDSHVQRADAVHVPYNPLRQQDAERAARRDFGPFHQQRLMREQAITTMLTVNRAVNSLSGAVEALSRAAEELVIVSNTSDVVSLETILSNLANGEAAAAKVRALREAARDINERIQQLTQVADDLLMEVAEWSNKVEAQVS